MTGSITSSTICAIIPTYNRSAYLRECIESVLAISPPVEQIIVIDDGSTDDTERVVQDYKERVIYLHKENGGKPSALNVALEKCTADYVWICDDDDLAAPLGLASLKVILDADEDIDFALGKYMAFQDEDPTRNLFDPQATPFGNDPNIKIRLLEEMFTSLNTLLVRRALYAKVGPFREDLIRSQDYDMILRLSRHAKAAEISETIFVERKHAGARGSSVDTFSVEARLNKWIEYDQKIFSSVRDEYALEEFTPTYAMQWDKPSARRAQLIQRVGVFAKCALWREAIEDFQQVHELNSGSVTHEELKSLERIVRMYAPWDILSKNPGLIASFRVFYAINKLSQTLVLAICRPIVWQTIEQIKKGNIGYGMQRVRLLVALLGVKGAVHRAYLSFIG